MGCTLCAEEIERCREAVHARVAQQGADAGVRPEMTTDSTLGTRCVEFCCCVEEIERCREAVKAKLARRQAQVSDLNEVQALLSKLEVLMIFP